MKIKRILDIFVLVMLFGIILYVALSPYSLSLFFTAITIRTNLDDYSDLLADIRSDCLDDGSMRSQGYCIHRKVDEQLGFVYSDCISGIDNLVDGGCCRDWSLFLAKVYSHFGWRYQYLHYYPEINHVRLDVYKSGTYCVIDVSEIVCVGVAE